jgi:fatty-acid desaturase
MDTLDLYFYSVSRTLVFFIVIALLVVMEYFFRLHRLGKAGFRKRRVLNWHLGLINMLVTFPISTLGAAAYCQYYQIGLFYIYSPPWWVVLIAWYVIYDFYVYLFHRVGHTALMWRFHKVHHTETSMNFTTTYRSHPIEFTSLTGIKIGLIILFGPYYFILLASDLIQALILFFGHSNIKLNARFEQILSKFIITPRYHLIHHTYQCDRNYATGLTLWDRLSHSYSEPAWTTAEINNLHLGLNPIDRKDSLKELLLINKLISYIKSSTFFDLKYSLFVVTSMLIFWGLAFKYPQIANGLIGSNLFYCLLYLTVALHVTLITISIYLHRSETHRVVIFHPVIRHFFRFFLWLFTGTDRKEWVAVHRLHHQNPDTEKDPHSPVVYGIKKLFTHGVELYNNAKTAENVAKYGCISDVDVLEKRLYGEHSIKGPIVLLFIQILLIGLWAIPLWTIQMALQIIIQATFINGFGHLTGYRNFNTEDNSHNITKWGVLISGEELHNNHHESPASAKFSYRSDEVDLGWFYICLLKKLGLATIKLKPVAAMDLKYKKSKGNPTKNYLEPLSRLIILMLCLCVFILH